MKKCFS